MKHFSALTFAFYLIAGIAVAQQAESILQREQIRRQEIVIRATMELQNAEKLLRQGKVDEATEAIREIVNRVPDSGEGKPVHARANALLSGIELERANQALQQGELFQARAQLQEVLKRDPGNATARELLAKVNSDLGVNSRGELSPAVDENLVADLKSIKDLNKRARDLFNTGQYDEAAETIGKILQIDPYNIQAAEYLKKINQKRYAVADLDRKLLREQLITDVRENWTEELRVQRDLEATRQEVVPINRSNEFAIQEKLRNTIIPSVEFVDATIQDATRFLTAKTRELDPEGTGVSFLLKNEDVLSQAQPFSLSLENIPASEVLRYITNLAGVKTRVEEFAVFIVPLSDRSDVLVTRDFPVRATFFDVEEGEDEEEDTRNRRRRAATTTTTQDRDTIRSALEFRGVTFSEGSTAIYNTATGILTVRNTQDQIDLIEELVTEDQGDSLMVRVESKFVEINQTDLDELTPIMNLQGTFSNGNTLVNNLPASAGSVSLTNGFSGAGNINPVDGINRIIEPTAARVINPGNANLLQNQVGITTALDGNQFSALINLISQKQSTDIMTAPSIIVNDGATGSVVVAREFSYPIEFDEPESVSGTTLGDTDGDGIGDTPSILTVVQPAFPTDFEERNVGVSLTVKPQISVDRQRVFVTLEPELVEFDGFVDYGAAINDPNVDQAPFPISQNEIKLPVFSTRTIEGAQMEIQDGYTMVLGGLIREDISTVEEKIPFLGDLPLLGRAFRSNAEQAIKRNLIIFISVRILRPDGEPYNLNIGSQEIAATPAR